MPVDDSWEWPILLYVGTVLLQRSEKEFWRMTPRKLNALQDAHITMNPTGESKSGSPGNAPKFIDQIF